jgi:hypothetical protein
VKALSAELAVCVAGAVIAKPAFVADDGGERDPLSEDSGGKSAF